jgi:hypothetical protein
VQLHKSVENAAWLMGLLQGVAMWPAALGFLKSDRGSFGWFRLRISRLDIPFDSLFSSYHNVKNQERRRWSSIPEQPKPSYPLAKGSSFAC